MTRKEAINRIQAMIYYMDSLNATEGEQKDIEAYRIAIKALAQEPYREIEDYENEIEGLQNRLDIAEYEKERLREEVTRLEEKIKKLEQEPKWIPVSERLPDTSAWVLATYKDQDGDICLDIMGINEWTGSWESRFDDDDFADGFIANVIAWMPLPPSYQGE